VTVGEAFTPETIQSYVDSGDWTPLKDEPRSEPDGDDQAPADEPQPEPDGDAASAGPRPSVNAPKADWIDYVYRRRLLSREDAVNYTKADLIEMCE
jgi:hypothetical protein